MDVIKHFLGIRSDHFVLTRVWGLWPCFPRLYLCPKQLQAATTQKRLFHAIANFCPPTPWLSCWWGMKHLENFSGNSQKHSPKIQESSCTLVPRCNWLGKGTEWMNSSSISVPTTPAIHTDNATHLRGNLSSPPHHHHHHPPQPQWFVSEPQIIIAITAEHNGT